MTNASVFQCGMEQLEHRRLLAAVSADAVYGAYINASFEDVLGRPVDAAARSAWVQQPDVAGIRVPLAETLTHSDEYFDELVRDDYQQILVRLPDSAGERFWLATLAAGANNEVLQAGLLASDEYRANFGATDAEWVNSLYSLLLGRTAGAAEERFWTAVLAGGTSRAEAARQMLGSPEHERLQVEADFQHYLGRGPDPTALNYFAASLGRGEREAELVSGLLASAEYFRHVTGMSASAVPVPTALDVAMGQGIQQQAAAGPDLAFVGDSLTWAWQNIGQAVWNDHFAPLHALNAGVPGDRTENALWRIQQGELQGIHPKLVIVALGTNNVEADSPADIADGGNAVVSALHQQFPDAKILVLNILPRGAAADDSMRQVGDAANSLISRLADGQTTFYLDVSSSFIHADGSLRTDLYLADDEHLNADGYQVWQSAMSGTINQLLNL